MWLAGVVVARYIDNLKIIITFHYSTCISFVLGSSIPTSLFIFKMFFRSCINVLILLTYDFYFVQCIHKLHYYSDIMRDSVPSMRYLSVYNVLHLWRISLIPTYRVYRLYDTLA